MVGGGFGGVDGVAGVMAGVYGARYAAERGAMGMRFDDDAMIWISGASDWSGEWISHGACNF